MYTVALDRGEYLSTCEADPAPTRTGVVHCWGTDLGVVSSFDRQDGSASDVSDVDHVVSWNDCFCKVADGSVIYGSQTLLDESKAQTHPATCRLDSAQRVLSYFYDAPSTSKRGRPALCVGDFDCFAHALSLRSDSSSIDYHVRTCTTSVAAH